MKKTFVASLIDPLIAFPHFVGAGAGCPRVGSIKDAIKVSIKVEEAIRRPHALD